MPVSGDSKIVLPNPDQLLTVTSLSTAVECSHFTHFIYILFHILSAFVSFSCNINGQRLNLSKLVFSTTHEPEFTEVFGYLGAQVSFSTVHCIAQIGNMM